MTPEKYEQLWKDLILTSINNYLSKHENYKLAVNEAKLKRDIWNVYENEYKPQFKNKCMIEKREDDSESVDSVPTGGGGGVKIDRHKVAALLYLSIVCNDNKPFLTLKGKPGTNNMMLSILACHEIAYSISLNCIRSFIEESIIQQPNCSHKNRFLSNGGFNKSPNLLCERYCCYKDSIIPRLVWAMEANDNKPHKLVSINANMLANIFYFLELHSAS